MRFSRPQNLARGRSAGLSVLVFAAKQDSIINYPIKVSPQSPFYFSKYMLSPSARILFRAQRMGKFRVYLLLTVNDDPCGPHPFVQSLAFNPPPINARSMIFSLYLNISLVIKLVFCIKPSRYAKIEQTKFVTVDEHPCGQHPPRLDVGLIVSSTIASAKQSKMLFLLKTHSSPQAHILSNLAHLEPKNLPDPRR